jgi:hypothetical protein
MTISLIAIPNPISFPEVGDDDRRVAQRRR